MGRYDGWEHAALRILEVLSVTWGGANSIIVTCDDKGVTKDQLWDAVELYDPDIWATHVPTYRGYQLQDPGGYEQFLDLQTDKLQSEHEGDRGDRRRQLNDFFMRGTPITDWEPPAAFWERTRSYLAPSWDREYGHAERIADDSMPTGLLVDVTQLTPLPDALVVPRTEELPLAARVLVHSRWGALGPSAEERLHKRGLTISEVKFGLGDVRNVVSASWSGADWFSAASGQLSASGPFAMSMVGLGNFVRPVPIRNDWPLAIVVGDTADDFALAMAIDRGMPPGLWVPPSLLGIDTVEVLASSLMSMRPPDDRHRTVHLTSCSLEAGDLEPVAHGLATALHDWPGGVRVSTRIPLPRDRPLTVMDQQLSSVLEDELFVGDTTGRGLRAQLPSGVLSDGPFNLSWWNDVVRLDHQLPSRWALNQHLVARSGAWRSRARVTREGLAFHSHPLGFISAGLRLDQVVDNPRLRFLGAKATFEVLAAEAGISLVESAAGRFTSRTIELWGGLSALIEDLQRPVVRAILDAFQSRAASGADPGNYILERRYLSLRDLETTLGQVDVVTDLQPLLDQFLQSGVLRRGLSMSCPRCRHFGWYDADDVGQSFRCWRCRSDTVIDSRVVRSGGFEPVWYYSLAEVVYQACRANFNVPVLALHRVAGDSRSVLGMTDHEVHFSDDVVEIDLWGLVNGRIIIGEAKSGPDLEASAAKRSKKAARLRRAADALTADALVLATSASSWSPSTRKTITQAFDGARCRIDFLVDVDPHLIEAQSNVSEEPCAEQKSSASADDRVLPTD